MHDTIVLCESPFYAQNSCIFIDTLSNASMQNNKLKYPRGLLVVDLSFRPKYRTEGGRETQESWILAACGHYRWLQSSRRVTG